MIGNITSKFIITSSIMLITISCQGGKQVNDEKKAEPLTKEKKMLMIELKSTAFTDGDTIPVKHTCDGQDISPLLNWSTPPEGTKSLTLICDDPDAPMGTWVHWVLFNIPCDVTELPEGFSVERAKGELAKATEGITSFKRRGYGGPCPPPGPAHRYFFKLYALDAKLELDKGANKADIEKAMEGHILAKGQLMGKYKR